MFSSTSSMSSSASAFGSPLLFGQTPIGYPSPFSTPPTSSSPFICASSLTGSQVKAPIFGPSESEKFSFGVNQGSRVTSYTKTTEFDDRGEGKMLVSISAMPAYSDKSHEELRWEDHHQFNVGGGGVVPASVQSNDFKNHFARTDSTFLNPITPSVSSNLFPVTVTPPSVGQHSFPNPAPPSVPSNPFAAAVTPRSIRQYSSLNPVPPSVPSSPFATTVTPCTIVQYSFMNHVKPNLKSVRDKMEEWEKSTQLMCKNVKCVQEDMKSLIKRDRSVGLEKIEATQTINQLREELAHVTRSKEAIIAEYLASPAFTKRLDEEHEKRLSKIFHPCYVKALCEVQTKFPEINPFTSHRPATGWFPPSPLNTLFSGEVQTKFPEINPFTSQRPATGWFPPSPLSTLFSGEVQTKFPEINPFTSQKPATGVLFSGTTPTPVTLDPCYARKEQENKKTSI